MSNRITYDNMPQGGNGTKPWLGFHEVGIQDIKDVSGNTPFPAAYAFEIELYQPGQKYPSRLQLSGDFVYGNGGDLEIGPLQKGLFYLFHVLDLDWGWTPRGELEDADGNKITNEANDLVPKLWEHVPKSSSHPPLNFYVYIWDKFSEKKKRAYATVYKHIVLNTPEERKLLEDEVGQMNERGIMVSWDGVSGLNGGSNVNISSGAEDVL